MSWAFHYTQIFVQPQKHTQCIIIPYGSVPGLPLQSNTVLPPLQAWMKNILGLFCSSGQCALSKASNTQSSWNWPSDKQLHVKCLEKGVAFLLLNEHRKPSNKHTCSSCPSVPYIAPSTPWESRHTTQLSTFRCSGRRQKLSMHVLMPYETMKNQKTSSHKSPRFLKVFFASCFF